MRHVFTFDASACTGCKACQVACKDKNQLPRGVLWRRVYEVTGGGWEQRGAAWTNNVFAYNVSVACNHCTDPACAAACPTGAYVVREDGIVCQEAEKCIGCEYCVWACPYGAPQYSEDVGRTTKCDFCRDLRDEGLPPACVAACPMRALDIVESAEGTPAPFGPFTQPFPLPSTSGARPRVALKPHPAMLNDLAKSVANYEEVRTVAWRTRLWYVKDLSLIAFTLLGQAAAGAAVLSLFTGLSPSTLVVIGLMIGAAAVLSLLHLGVPGQAWRAPNNVRTSALSREILALGLFAAAWVVSLLVPRVGQVALAVFGVLLVESMARVYQLEAVPGWEPWRTRLTFATSALLLGGSAIFILRGTATMTGSWSGFVLTLFMIGAVLQQVASRRAFYRKPAAKLM